MNLSRSRNHSLTEIKIILGTLMLTLTSTVMAGEGNRLKIETVNARAANVVSATAKQMHDKVYVSGLVRLNRPYQPAPGAHVDVYLLNANGQTLARKKDHVLVTSQKRDRTQGGQFPYAVSFNNTIATKAATARVVSCSGGHNDQG